MALVSKSKEKTLIILFELDCEVSTDFGCNMTDSSSPCCVWAPQEELCILKVHSTKHCWYKCVLFANICLRDHNLNLYIYDC